MADKKRTVEFEHDKILALVDLLNSITVSGFKDIRSMTMVANILDSGVIKATSEKIPKESETDK